MPDGWPHLLLWAPNGWTHGGFPFVCGRLMAGLTEVSPPDSICCPLCGRPMAGPNFSCGRLTAGRMEVPIPINPSSHLRRPISFPAVLTASPSSTPPPPLFLFCPRHPTHYADYHSDVLCRIPGHRLALIPSLIIPTTEYVLHLEHKPLRCEDGINKHT